MNGVCCQFFRRGGPCQYFSCYQGSTRLFSPSHNTNLKRSVGTTNDSIITTVSSQNIEKVGDISLTTSASSTAPNTLDSSGLSAMDNISVPETYWEGAMEKLLPAIAVISSDDALNVVLPEVCNSGDSKHLATVLSPMDMPLGPVLIVGGLIAHGIAYQIARRYPDGDKHRLAISKMKKYKHMNDIVEGDKRELIKFLHQLGYQDLWYTLKKMFLSYFIISIASAITTSIVVINILFESKEHYRNLKFLWIKDLANHDPYRIVNAFLTLVSIMPLLRNPMMKLKIKIPLIAFVACLNMYLFRNSSAAKLLLITAWSISAFLMKRATKIELPTVKLDPSVVSAAYNKKVKAFKFRQKSDAAKAQKEFFYIDPSKASSPTPSVPRRKSSAQLYQLWENFRNSL